MTQGTLCLHRGAREVPRSYVNEIAETTPRPQGRWHPVSHAKILDLVSDHLADAGFAVQKERIGLSRDDGNMFAVLDLNARVSDAGGGITLSCGIINSVSKKLAARLAMGSRVLCCDNLSLAGSQVLARKHTTNILKFLNEGIPVAVRKLEEFQQAETKRLVAFQQTVLQATDADAIMLRAFDQRVVNHVQLRQTIQLWRNPTEEAFAERTLFSLENAFTTVLSDVLKTNPIRFASASLRLQGLLQASCPIPSEPPYAASA